MVQIVKNWSRIVGAVERWEPPSAPGEPGTLTMRVQRVSDVPGLDAEYKNLLTGSEGQRLEVHVPPDDARAAAFKPGQIVEMDVRRGRSPIRVFARPGLKEPPK